MIQTLDLIERLAADTPRVKRLRPPAVRVVGWMLLAAVVFAFLAVIHGTRPDLATRLKDPVFATALAASLGTGMLAALGCFLGSLPDRSRLWLLLPVPSLVAWLSTIGYGCLTDWVGPDGLRPGEAVGCFLTLLIVRVPLSAAMFGMIRHVARLRPAVVTMTAGLAVAALASAALSLFHQLDATIMVLIWNLGMAGAVAVADWVLGRRYLTRMASGTRATEAMMP